MALAGGIADSEFGKMSVQIFNPAFFSHVVLNVSSRPSITSDSAFCEG